MLRTFLAFLFLSGALLAADRKTAIDQLVQPAIDESYLTGVVVGIFDGGKTQVFGYGMARHDSFKAPDGKTVFEIGPATQAFTGLALAEMAERKMVQLDDPIRKLLPASALPPPQEGKPEITLTDLAIHCSGLPFSPTDLKPKDPANPYADYGVEQLYGYLKQQGVVKGTGIYYRLSYLGTGLLGHGLALRNGSSYEAMIRSLITKPLGMNDTGITLSAALQQRLAEGHNIDGNPAPVWQMGALAGAGALHSTADDLLRFIAANINPPKKVEAAIRTAQAGHKLPGADTEGITLGWQIQVDHATLSQSGGTAGFYSFVSFNRDRQTGVVVLANTAAPLVTAIALRVQRMLAGETVEPLTLRHAITFSNEALDRYVGKYELDPNKAYFTVWREGDHLMGEVTGQRIFRMYPEAEDKFFLKVTASEITFKRDEKGQLISAFLSQHGHGLLAKRVP